MILQIAILIAGLLLILLGANYLVDGSSSIARRFGLSEFVIGLTIVGIGTSTPEMVVSFLSAFQGKADMAIGNIVGSNIFNTMLILGVTALIAPLTITRSNLKRDIPLNIGVTVLLILLGMSGTIFRTGTDMLSRVDGIILLAVFAWYMWLSDVFFIRVTSVTSSSSSGRQRIVFFCDSGVYTRTLSRVKLKLASSVSVYPSTFFGVAVTAMYPSNSLSKINGFVESTITPSKSNS